MMLDLKTRKISNFGRPYVIAELGANHNGDMDLAKRMISEAKASGADCVKFQSWTAKSIFSTKAYEDNYFIADDYRDRKDHTLESIVEEYSISEAELMEMKAFADEVGIDCSSTPFSEREADFLVDEMKASFIKVASMDLNNYPFLRYLAKKQLPIILSTGLSELFEIDRAVRTIEEAGNKQIAILHCVAIYPPRDEQVNLKRIQTLQQLYPDYTIGFSDHTLGIEVPLASVAFGAAIIEKHFTLDKDMEGWDHKVSASPEELKSITKGVEKIWNALGTGRLMVEEDQERKVSFRRSIVLKEDVRRGDIITRENIDFKRPGEGVLPGDIDWVVGRTAKEDIKADIPVHKENLL